VELSSIYHDVIKDRMYTDPANSPRRRSTQTALHRLVTGLSQMLSPILAFTADEAWEFVPGKPTGSVHEAVWKGGCLLRSKTEIEIWNSCFALREHVSGYLEKSRQDKIIGKSLDAKVTISGKGEGAHHWNDNKEALRELLNVSQFVCEAQSIDTFDIPLGKTDASSRAQNKMYFEELAVEISKADGHKCERCWHWETDIGQSAEHPTLCGRCVEAVKPLKV